MSEAQAEAIAGWGISENAARVHHDSYGWDNTLPWLDKAGPETRLALLPRMKSAGYRVISLTLGFDLTSLSEMISKIAKERCYFLAHAEEYVLVETADDIERAKREGKLAIIFHIQGTNPVNCDINMISTYYHLGIRHMLMAYNLRNAVGDGCKERTDEGLSRFGVQLVGE